MKRLFIAAFMLVSVWSSQVNAQSKNNLDELLRFVPDDANVLMVVRVQDILKSERAVKEGWAKKQEEAWLAGAEAIPPFLTDLVRASRLHLEDSSVGWSIGVARTVQNASIQKIVDHHGGTVEQLGKARIVKTPKNSIYSVLGPKLVGVMSPAYRQEASRWLRKTAANQSVTLGEYLVTSSKNPAQIVIAIDAQDMLDPELLKNWLASTKALEGKENKIKAVSNIYLYLKGITLAVHIGETSTLDLTLDFGTAVGSSSVEVKNVLLEYLEETGAALSDLESAELKTKGQQVTLSAPLTDAGLRRIFSMVVTPNPADSHGESAPPAPQQDIDARKSKQASQRYFSTVQQMIDDLSAKANRANNYDKTATWHDNYAKKIDHLSTKDVDPALVEYGHHLSSQLRALAASLRGVSLKLSTAQGQLVVDYSVNPGQVGGWGPGAWWGGAVYTPPTWRATSNLEQVRQKQADAVEKGASEREQLWQAIENDRQSIRSKMIGKFGEDFAGKT